MRLFELETGQDSYRYENLLRLLADFGGYFMLAKRGQSSGPGEEWTRRLERAPWCTTVPDAMEWPGTRVLTATQAATLLKCRVCSESLEQLAAGPQRLTSWRKNSWPEDLSFLREDGRAWFTSISHEGCAYFTITDDEAVQVRSVLGRNSIEDAGREVETQPSF